MVRGCFYCALLPVWEGYDEPYHFAFIQYVAAHKGLPVPSTPVSREVQESMHLLPLSWEQRLHALTPPIYTEDSYWRLSPADRHALQQQVLAVPREWGRETGTTPALYEAQQVPLYYWVMAGPLGLAAQWSLPARVFLVRILGVLMASWCIPFGYAAARICFSNQAHALGVVAVITCMPELMIDICRVCNDSLAIAFYSLLTLLLLLAVRPGGCKWSVPAGIVLGLGLATKAYFLFAIPAFIAVALWSAIRNKDERTRVIVNSALGLLVAAFISFGVYWRNHVVTGSWSGEQDAAVAAHRSLLQLIVTIRHVDWYNGINSVLISHVWFGGWSFLKLGRRVYKLSTLVTAVAIFGVVKTVIRQKPLPSALIVPLSLYLFFWIGLLCNILAIYISLGVSASSCGWYLYAVIVPEILLLAYGLFAVVPLRWRGSVLPALVSGFAAIDLYSVHALLVPYYTGVICHSGASDFVRPVKFMQLVHAGPHLLLERLTANRPAVLEPWGIALLFLAYYAATLGTVVMTYVINRSGHMLTRVDSDGEAGVVQHAPLNR
jgi:4-amino-4-deoxy-L-arabinose transferase-like glycosyltransferase